MLDKRAHRGFTVLELMIAIALVAILLAIAVPSFRTAIQNNRITAQANEVLVSFQLARSEALKRNARVAVCASDDGENCTGGWTDGWIVVMDGNNAGSNSVSPGEVIRVWAPPPDGMTFAGGNNFYRFLATGGVDGESGQTIPNEMTISIPECRGDQVRNIEIERSGRVSVERSACS